MKIFTTEAQRHGLLRAKDPKLCLCVSVVKF